MFLTILLLSVAIVAISLLGMGVKIFFSKSQKFPETGVGQNKALRKKKVFCIKTEQKLIDKQINLGVLNGGSCSSCDED